MIGFARKLRRCLRCSLLFVAGRGGGEREGEGVGDMGSCFSNGSAAAARRTATKTRLRQRGVRGEFFFGAD